MVAQFKPQYDHPKRKLVSAPHLHHFFVTDDDYCFLCDVQGKVLVFLTPDSARATAETMPFLAKGYQVVGMGDVKWELFQKTEVYRIVEGK